MNETNPVLQAILQRRSVRSYTDEPVANDDITEMLRAAMAAPSAKDVRPWCFLVTTDKAKLAAMAEVLPNGKMLPKTPVAIMVGADLDIAEAGTPGNEYWTLDCSAAMENLLLAAEALGYGAVWLGVKPIQERMVNIKRILELPDHIAPLGVVALGRPKDAGQAKNKFDAARIHWEKW